MLSGPYQRLRCWVNSEYEYSVPTARPRSAAVVARRGDLLPVVALRRGDAAGGAAQAEARALGRRPGEVEGGRGDGGRVQAHRTGLGGVGDVQCSGLALAHDHLGARGRAGVADAVGRDGREHHVVGAFRQRERRGPGGARGRLARDRSGLAVQPDVEGDAVGGGEGQPHRAGSLVRLRGGRDLQCQHRRPDRAEEDCSRQLHVGPVRCVEGVAAGPSQAGPGAAKDHGPGPPVRMVAGAAQDHPLMTMDDSACRCA